MRRILLFLSLFFLTFSSAKAQSPKFDCSSFNGGAFYYYGANDTIVVYRGLEYWIEADVRNHECLIYKIEWTDACNFVLKFNGILEEDKNHSQDSSKILILKQSLSEVSIDSTGITYKVKDMAERYQNIMLHPLKDTMAWQYLIYADSNLYIDTAEVKKLYGKPEQKFYSDVPYFINLETDSGETHFVDYVISLFQKGDIVPAFDYASQNLKKHSPQTVIEDYNEYVQHLFGKLKSYKVISIKDGYQIRKNANAHTYIIHGEFEKVSGGADICINVDPESYNRLLSVNVVMDSANKIPILKEMTGSFWSLMTQKRYREIYDSGAKLLKEKVPFEEAKKSFVYLDSIGHLNDYKLYFQNFSATGEKGTIILSYKCTLPDKSLFMNLLYIFENGEYRLGGVDTPKRQ